MNKACEQNIDYENLSFVPYPSTVHKFIFQTIRILEILFHFQVFTNDFT
jgi:hypothetical protein